jgi:hypothetical protein
MCTFMLDTQTDAPPCPLWHMSEHFWSNCAKGVFHSSAQIFVVVVATRSHSSLNNTPKRIVWCGKVRTTWWPWQWCRRCRWATANPAAWKKFVQNIAHRKSEVCGCPIVLCLSAEVWATSPTVLNNINITMYELVRTQLYLNMVHGVVSTINYMFRPLYWPSSGLHYV